MSTFGRLSPRGKLIRFVVPTLTLQTWDKKKLRFMLVWLESFCTLHSSTVDSTRLDHTTVLVNMGEQEFIQWWWWPLSHTGPSQSVLHLHPDQRRLHPVLLCAQPDWTVAVNAAKNGSKQEFIQCWSCPLSHSGPSPSVLHLHPDQGDSNQDWWLSSRLLSQCQLLVDHHLEENWSALLS